MKKCFFLTGTDTNVGKTVASCAILESGREYGYTTVGYKPIASGSGKIFSSVLRNKDALLLQKYSSLNLDYNEVNPINFSQKTSPNIASNITKRKIDFQIITKGLNRLKKKSNLIIIEGVGGWKTPISDNKTLSDWVISENIPIILVVGLKLGCINHTILTIDSIKNSGLPLIGWIANEVDYKEKYKQYYLSTLDKIISYFRVGCIPNLKNWESSFIGKFIDLKKILY